MCLVMRSFSALTSSASSSRTYRSKVSTTITFYCRVASMTSSAASSRLASAALSTSAASYSSPIMSSNFQSRMVTVRSMRRLAFVSAILLTLFMVVFHRLRASAFDSPSSVCTSNYLMRCCQMRLLGSSITCCSWSTVWTP